MEMGKEYISYSHRRNSRYSGNEYSTSKKECSINILRKIILLTSLSFYFVSCGSKKVVIRNNSQPTQKKEVIKTSKKVKTTAKTELVSNKEKIDNYIEKFGPIARDEMKAFGVPASITLAQGILESGMGYGRLALQGNNHFGIKCHSDWKGKRIYHDDDLKAECFRVYNDPATSYRDHSLFLTGRSRYSFLFDIKTSNYEAWAKGLKKAGYATDPEYPDKLISLIERFDLTRYDIKKSKKSIAEKSKNIIKQKQTHTVQKGDTLYSVSRKYDISIDKLVEINQINDKTIYIGQKLKIITKN
jgi:flagellum-specific peptidoglycan hydrolase FlgJ